MKGAAGATSATSALSAGSGMAPSAGEMDVVRVDGRTARLQSSVSETLDKLVGDLEHVNLEKGPSSVVLDKNKARVPSGFE